MLLVLTKIVTRWNLLLKSTFRYNCGQHKKHIPAHRTVKQFHTAVITICIKYANTSKILTYILIPNKT